MGLESIVNNRASDRVSVSVVITTYNRKTLIRRALDSVLGQDFQSELMEVIVVDDGSTDGTAELIQSQYGDRVRYHYKPNGGMNSASQAGIELAKGDVIALLDSDDYWYPNKLATCMPLFAQCDDVVAVLHDLDRVDSTSGEKYDVVYGSAHSDFDTAPRDALGHYLAGNPVRAITSGMLLRRSAALKTLPFPIGLRSFHDTYYIRNIIFYGRICAIHSPLGAYAVHGSNDYGFRPPRELTDARLAEMISTGRLMIESFNRRCLDFAVSPSPRRSRIQTFASAELMLEQQRRTGVVRAIMWIVENELRISPRERLNLLTRLTLPTRAANFVNNRILSGATLD